MNAGPSHLVEILLPKETGSGQSAAQQWFKNLLKELTERDPSADQHLGCVALAAKG